MFSKKEAGYTLLEIIVSMSIIAVVGGVLIYSLYGAGRVARLDQAAQNVQTAIREAHTQALSPAGTDPDISKAYGVRITTEGSSEDSTYKSLTYKKVGGSLLLDTLLNQTLTSGIEITNIKEINSSGVVIKEPDLIYVIFTAPFGKAYISSEDPSTWTWTEVDGVWQLSPVTSGVKTTITLEEEASGLTRDININSQTGEVTIEKP